MVRALYHVSDINVYLGRQWGQEVFKCILHVFCACPEQLYSFLYFVVCIWLPSLTENQTVGSPGNEDVNVCMCLCGNDNRKHKISVYTKLPYKEVAFILHIWCLLNWLSILWWLCGKNIKVSPVFQSSMQSTPAIIHAAIQYSWSNLF